MAAQAGPRRKRVATYDYCDEDDELLFQVVRYEPKDFRQRQLNPDHPEAKADGWAWTLEGVRRVPYRLPEVLFAAATESVVYVVEGEKDADALAALGEVATCNPGGAGKWLDEYVPAFDGLTVVIVADRDEPGRNHARQVAASLRGVAASVRVVEPRQGKDVSDHLDAGFSVDDFVPVEMDETEPRARYDLLLDRAAERAVDEGRNNACLWLVCQLRDNLYPESEARALVEKWRARVAGRGDHAFPRAEAMEVFDKNFFTDARAPWMPDGGTPLTDYGNAERLVRRHGQDLRYVHAWRCWLWWDGRRWRRDATGEVERRAKATVRAMYREAAREVDPDRRQKLAGWARQSEHATRIRMMIDLARSEPGVAVEPHQLDANPWELNCLNGTLHLGSGKLFDHRRDALITKLAPVEYNPHATSETWNDFLRRVVPDEADRRYLRRIIGYALTGETREQCFLVFYGFGSNGKSTFIETVRAMLGDYAQQASPELFLLKRPGSIPVDIARLHGARFVTASETDDGARLNEAQIKQLTGGDRITARYLHQNPFEFEPTHKLHLVTNHKPQIRGSDEAIWRRVRLFPFSVTIKDSDRDDRLPELLRRPHTLAAVLRWAVEGCQEWQRNGLGTSPNVTRATAEYRDESDVFGQFLEDCCATGPDQRTPSADLFECYRDWARDNGYQPMTAKSFGLKLKERAFEPCKIGQARGWRGIGVTRRADGKLRIVAGGGE